MQKKIYNLFLIFQASFAFILFFGFGPAFAEPVTIQNLDFTHHQHYGGVSVTSSPFNYPLILESVNSLDSIFFGAIDSTNDPQSYYLIEVYCYESLDDLLAANPCAPVSNQIDSSGRVMFEVSPSSYSGQWYTNVNGVYSSGYTLEQAFANGYISERSNSQSDLEALVFNSWTSLSNLDVLNNLPALVSYYTRDFPDTLYAFDSSYVYSMNITPWATEFGWFNYSLYLDSDDSPIFLLNLDQEVVTPVLSPTGYIFSTTSTSSLTAGLYVDLVTDVLGDLIKDGTVSSTSLGSLTFESVLSSSTVSAVLGTDSNTALDLASSTFTGLLSDYMSYTPMRYLFSLYEARSGLRDYMLSGSSTVIGVVQMDVPTDSLGGNEKLTIMDFQLISDSFSNATNQYTGDKVSDIVTDVIALFSWFGFGLWFWSFVLRSLDIESFQIFATRATIRDLEFRDVRAFKAEKLRQSAGFKKFTD